jgi:hypothetical protein
MKGGLFAKPRKLSRGTAKRMSEADFLAWQANLKGDKQPGEKLAPVAKPSKYRNRKCEHEGMTFDSKRELKRWLELRLRERAGEIRDLQRQVPFVLADRVDLGEKRIKPALRYYADFVYVETATGDKVVEDAKGKVVPEYRTKKHLMASVHKLIIREV